MRVLLNIYPWYLPKRNRELRVHLDLLALGRQFGDMEFQLVTSPVAAGVGNLLFVLNWALGRTGLARRVQSQYWYYALRHVNYVPGAHVRAKRCDLFFAHEYFPVNLRDDLLPIVYETQLLPIESLPHYGMPAATRRLETRLKASCAQRSTLVTVRDPSAANIFGELFPRQAYKVRITPWYVPYLEPTDEDVLRWKHTVTNSRCKVLFVGNEAIRKGLPTLLRALELLRGDLRAKMDVNVVSRFLDGPVSMPRVPVDVCSNLTQEAVLNLMREAHVFVLPTHADTFGIVLLEAMALGCAVISSKQQPQAWMLDSGRAGLLVEPTDPKELARLIEQLVEKPEERLRMALAGRQRFVSEFHHTVVGRRYRQVFDEAIETWHGSRGSGAAGPVGAPRTGRSRPAL